MKYEVAQGISDTMLEITKMLDLSLQRVQKETMHEEFTDYRYAVGEVMTAILIGILNNIYDEHPGLKPKEMN